MSAWRLKFQDQQLQDDLDFRLGDIFERIVSKSLTEERAATDNAVTTDQSVGSSEGFKVRRQFSLHDLLRRPVHPDLLRRIYDSKVYLRTNKSDTSTVCFVRIGALGFRNGPIQRNTTSPDRTAYSSAVLSGEIVFRRIGPRVFHREIKCFLSILTQC